MNDDAAASTIAFLVAVGLFVVLLGGLLLTTDQVADSDAVQAQDATLLGQRALHVRDLVLGSPGYGLNAQSEPVDWLSGDAMDNLKRLGLRNATGPDISFAKLENLRLSPKAAGDDGYLNYDEARSALGLTQEGLDFHIRAHPSLKSVQELLDTATKDSNLRVTYIGDALTSSQGGGGSPTVGAPTCTLSPLDNQAIRIEVPVSNTGSTTTQLHGAFTIEFGNKDIDDTQGGAVVGPGASTTLALDVPAKHGDCDDVTEVVVDVFDPSASLAIETTTPSFSAVGATTGGDVFRVDPDRVYHTTLQTVQISYDGDLDPQNGPHVGETLVLDILDATDTSVLPGTVTDTITVPKNNDPWVFGTFDASDLGVGTYTITLTRSNGQVASDLLVIEAGSLDNFGAGGATSYTYSTAAAAEVGFLDSLVYRFCPYEWDSQSAALIAAPSWTARCEDPSHGFPSYNAAYPSGHFSDVLPDDKQLLGNELHRRLTDSGGNPAYDVVNTLVVGSGVDHNTMTSQVVKGTIRDWVLGGGTLIVFGSEKQVVQWLQPIFKASLDSSSTGLSAPDEQHPLLHVSDELAWDAYDHQGRAWDLKQDGGNAANFTRVVQDEGDNSVLAISDAGAYGSGTVILTSWLPYDLFGDGSYAEAEALKLINNLLMQGYRDLFLDYGPEIPEGGTVTAALGRGQVWHPQLERHVTLDIEFYVFA